MLVDSQLAEVNVSEDYTEECIKDNYMIKQILKSQGRFLFVQSVIGNIFVGIKLRNNSLLVKLFKIQIKFDARLKFYKYVCNNITNV